MDIRRAALMLGVAALFATAGWAIGRWFPAPLSPRSNSTGPATPSMGELSPAMRQLLLSMDETQRRMALQALSPDTARLARQLFKRRPLPSAGNLFDAFDTDYDGFIDPREFDEALPFIRIVPPPSAQQPANQPADLKMLLFLDALEALERRPPLLDDEKPSRP